MNEQDNFLTHRNDFAELIGKPDLYDQIDHFALYAGARTLGSKLFTYELFKQTLGLAGDVVEFGCWRGSNLMFLAKTLFLHQPLTTKKVFGFDNFSGLPSPSIEDGVFAPSQKGNYRGNEEVLRAAIELFGLSRKVELVVGDARETIPKFQERAGERLLSFAFVDFDLYEPTRVALQLIDQSLVLDGIVVFDQAGSEEWPGETLALKEFLEASPFVYKSISNPLTAQPTMAFKKIGPK